MFAVLAALLSRSSAGGLSRVEETVLPGGGWAIDSVAWLAGEEAIVASAVAVPAARSTIYIAQATADGRKWLNLRTLASMSCDDPDVLIFPVATGPHTFAYIEGCLAGLRSAPHSKLLREYSVRNGRTRSIYDYGLPYPSAAFALRPGSDEGLLNDGTGLKEKLRWLEPERLSEPVPLELDRVGDPAWSPEGDVVALSGVSGIATIRGPARADASRWRLFIAQSDLANLVKVSDLAYQERPFLAWSPNGAVLATAGQTDGSQGEVRLIRARDRRSIVVRAGLYGALTWLDDSRIAVVRHEDYSGGGGDVLEILDVSAGREHLEELSSSTE